MEPAEFDQFLALMFAQFGFRVDDCLKSLAGHAKGFLSIGGRSLPQIINDPDLTEEDFESLMRHMDTKRPHLRALFKRLDPAGAELLRTGKVRNDVDFDAIAIATKKALQADQVEAAKDTCKWASMEWKWQPTARD